MKKWAKGILSPIVFVGGTAEAIVKGATNILEAGGDTITSTLTNGASRVAQLWDEENISNPATAGDKDTTPVPSSQTQTTDAFQILNNNINKTCRSRKLIDNAEQIRALIRDGSELGVESMVIHCTKNVGAEIKGGIVLPAYTLGVSVSGNDDGTVSIEVKYK